MQYLGNVAGICAPHFWNASGATDDLGLLNNTVILPVYEYSRAPWYVLESPTCVSGRTDALLFYISDMQHFESDRLVCLSLLYNKQPITNADRWNSFG